MKFVFRLDFGPKTGWGHLSRSLEIASELVKKGHEIVIATQSHTERHWRLAELSERGALEVRWITAYKTQNNNGTARSLDVESQVADAIETLKISQSVRADVIVLDDYLLGSTWINTVRTSFPVCLICDFPAQSQADFIVDYGFDASAQKHLRGRGSQTKFMLGSAFAPVAESYSRFRTPPHEDVNQLSRVLVSLGGFGEELLASQIMNAIFEVAPDIEVHVAGDPSRYRSLSLYQAQHKLSIAHEAGLASQLAASGTAIVGAGVTMYELLASGYLGLVIQTASNQELALASALQKGHLRGVQKSTKKNLAEKVAKELDIRSRSRTLEWLKARSLVDHLGPARLAYKLEGHPSMQPRLREVKVADLPFILRLSNQASSRAASPNSSIIEPWDHWEWSKGFFDGRKLGWVFGTSELPLGHCRLEREGSDYFLSYLIQEEFQGEGLGGGMLKTLFEQPWIPQRVFARVKPENVASQRALRKVGFVFLFGNERLLTMVRET